MKVAIWNPSLGQDYVLVDHPSRQSFSSLRSDMFVAEAIGVHSWVAKSDGFRRLFDRTSVAGFFYWNAWRPRRESDIASVVARVRGAVRSTIGVSGTFSESSVLASIVAIREEVGGASAGEWLIGGVRPGASVPESNIELGFSDCLSNVESLGMLIYWAEQHQTFLLARRYEGVDRDISELLAE
jgi:hypothetical protein